MTDKIFVKPAPGLKQRLPDNPREFLPEEGMEVERNAFWLRRLADGDVQLAAAPIEAVTVNKAAAKAPSKKE